MRVNKLTEPELSIIIPFGLSPERAYLRDRIIEKVNYFYKIAKILNIEVLFVEGFSKEEDSRIKSYIESKNLKYFKDTSLSYFNLARCRNIGASRSKSNVIMFLDADYYISNIELEIILLQIKENEIENNQNNFLILPCAFLTEQGTKKISLMGENNRSLYIKCAILNKNTEIVDFVSMASSSIVMNKHKYLEIGGTDETFIGHGFEDFDLFWRLIYFTGHILTPPINIQSDKHRWQYKSYEGFRPLFGLIGQESFCLGVCLYHCWHICKNIDGYFNNKEINKAKFLSHLRSDFEINECPLPIPIAEKENTDIFYIGNREIIRGLSPYLGRIVYTSYEELNRSTINHARRKSEIIIDATESYEKGYLKIKKTDIPVRFIRNGIIDNCVFITNSLQLSELKRFPNSIYTTSKRSYDNCKYVNRVKSIIIDTKTNEAIGYKDNLVQLADQIKKTANTLPCKLSLTDDLSELASRGDQELCAVLITQNIDLIKLALKQKILCIYPGQLTLHIPGVIYLASSNKEITDILDSIVPFDEARYQNLARFLLKNEYCIVTRVPTGFNHKYKILNYTKITIDGVEKFHDGGNPPKIYDPSSLMTLKFSRNNFFKNLVKILFTNK